MKPLRWILAGLLWIVASLVFLVGLVLCATLVLLPLGLPVTWLAKRIYAVAGRLVLPKAVRHPVAAAGDKTDELGRRARRRTRKTLSAAAG